MRPRAVCSGELVATGRATVVSVEPPEALDRTPPRTVGGPPIDMLRHYPSHHPALSVIDVVDASVVGATGWVVVDGAVVTDLSWYGDAWAAETSFPGHHIPRVELQGTTLSLLSDFAAQNYGHLLYDAVPRLDLFERAGGDLDEIDHILCPGPVDPHPVWHELGLPVDRIVVADPMVVYGTHRLVATSFPGTRRVLPRWAVRFLRERLSVPGAGPARRRLYLGRGTSRRLSNEAALTPRLLELGFEIVDPGADRIDARPLFATADLVVGAHGAALADIVFCPPGARVLEIVPTDHVYPHWFAAARSSGLDYRCIAAASSTVRAAGALGPSPFDVTVDVARFMAALDQLIEESEST